jgi:uncharacterized damage-inducible protein DinB
VKHISSAEIRYVDRLSNRPITDATSIPNDNVQAIFHFGDYSRRQLKEPVTTLPAKDWDIPHDYQILKYRVVASPRKIVTHILMHEVRHWAQIATVLRLNGALSDPQDFLASPVMGGDVSVRIIPGRGTQLLARAF